jgi:hypothetical protein
MRGRFLALVAALALPLSSTAAASRADPRNPTCPEQPNWGNTQPMRFSARKVSGKKVLVAEGAIDDNLLTRLNAALDHEKPVDEIWFRSPGGNARVGNQAGMAIRKLGIPTRIPAGWACFSACNFLFMGGPIRVVDPGGLFIVHMFTHTGDRQTIEAATLRGTDNTVGLIGEIEQDSAMLASEDNDFLIRMGVSRKLLTEIMYRQSAVSAAGQTGSTRRCLTQDEVHRYNVANFR